MAREEILALAEVPPGSVALCVARPTGIAGFLASPAFWHRRLFGIAGFFATTASAR